MSTKDTAYRKANSPKDARRYPVEISKDSWMYIDGNEIYLSFVVQGPQPYLFEISTRTMIAALKRRGLLPRMKGKP